MSLCHGRYAENEDEEANAEAQADRSDEIYDRMRDENSEEMMNGVDELITRLSKLMYYKNRKEGLAKDLIQHILLKLNLKIERLDSITSKYQSLVVVADSEEISCCLNTKEIVEEFFKRRFPEKDLEFEKKCGYFDKWLDRFRGGHPEGFADEVSLKVLEEMKKEGIKWR